jgi:hypothetical protein
MAVRKPWFEPFDRNAAQVEAVRRIEDPAHELELALEAAGWFGARRGLSLLDTVAEATDLGGEDCA